MQSGFCSWRKPLVCQGVTHTGAEKLHWNFFSFKESVWSFLWHLGSDSFFPGRMPWVVKEAEERDFVELLHSKMARTSRRSKTTKRTLDKLTGSLVKSVCAEKWRWWSSSHCWGGLILLCSPSSFPYPSPTQWYLSCRPHVTEKKCERNTEPGKGKCH